MARNRWRFDPYKNFNFRVVAAAAVAGVAAFGVATKLFASRRKKKRPPATEADSGARPIEAVGTSTAGFVGTAPRKAKVRNGKRNGRRAS